MQARFKPQAGQRGVLPRVVSVEGGANHRYLWLLAHGFESRSMGRQSSICCPGENAELSADNARRKRLG
jgi:hypothetical protein